jgi:hypothetical protein
MWETLEWWWGLKGKRKKKRSGEKTVMEGSRLRNFE